MRSIRKLALAGLAALMVCAAVASSASAASVTIKNASGTTLAAGAAISLTNSGNSVLTGSFFGFGATTITCTGFSASGAIVHNPGAAASITAASFTGCTNQNGVNCGTIAGNSLPWSPAVNNGGIVATSPTSVSVGTGSSGSFTIPGVCTPTGQPCTVKGAGASVADGAGDHSVTNRVTGTWTNPNGTTSPPQAVISAAAVNSSTGCITSGTWSTKAIVTSGGSNLSLS